MHICATEWLGTSARAQQLRLVSILLAPCFVCSVEHAIQHTIGQSNHSIKTAEVEQNINVITPVNKFGRQRCVKALDLLLQQLL